VTPSLTRVALVEGGMLQEIWQQKDHGHGCVGTIFKGLVKRVIPGLQAAFVDIGLERTAFLHLSDMAATGRSSRTESVNIAEITSLLHESQELIVQVIKDPLGTKGARLSTNISIPSRFLVLLPKGNSIGISSRIEDEDERQRLKELVDDLSGESSGESSGFGYIVRTQAEGVSRFALAADMTYLQNVWQSIQDHSVNTEAAKSVYQDISLPVRIIRDLMREDIARVRIDSPAIFAEARQFTSSFIPEWSSRIEFYSEDRPILDLYGVEEEINAALQREVPLKSGGFLVFDQTEAMTTVDVNSGSFTGHKNLEDTIFKTNLEATHGIARQLRLRNLGGIIMLDFIDMHDADHRRQVIRALRSELESDHARTSVSELSALGLVEMTRKRTAESLEQRLCIPCPNCAGRGTIKSSATVCWEIMREIMRSGRQNKAKKFTVLASPQVVAEIVDAQSGTVENLEELTGMSICFKPEEQYNQEQFDVVPL
jgi:ribonuclease G